MDERKQDPSVESVPGADIPIPGGAVDSLPNDFIQPSEFTRSISGRSVFDVNSVVDSASGRMFHHEEGKYFLPNDGPEQDRLDIQHKMVTLLFSDKLFLAPLNGSPEYVLDVATGTGIWAWEFAERHPTSHVIGTDISKIQWKDGLPRNLEFIIDDAEKEWVFPVNGFDFIHFRYVFTCFSDHKKVMKSAFDNLKPGGWIEYQDAVAMPYSQDGTHKGTAVETFWDLFNQGLAKLGRDPYVATHYKEWLEELGCVDVVLKRLPIPANAWPADPRLELIGAYALKDGYDGARGIGWKLFTALGKSPLEIETLVSDYRRDISNEDIHTLADLWVVYGRKPFEGEVATKVKAPVG